MFMELQCDVDGLSTYKFECTENRNVAQLRTSTNSTRKRVTSLINKSALIVAFFVFATKSFTSLLDDFFVSNSRLFEIKNAEQRK